MPTLSRFITLVVVLVLVAYGAMFALATFVKPRQAEMVVPIAPERLNPPAAAP